MKTILRSSLWVAVLLVLYFAGILNYASSLAQGAVIHSGFVDAAPDDKSNEPFDFNFAVKDLTGKKIDFNDFKGKVIFLNLWATWCAPCRSEMPAIQNLYEEMDQHKVFFVMLSLDKDTQLRKVKAFVSDKSFTFPVFMPAGYLSQQLQVPSIPTTLVIDKNGNIVFKEVGMRNYHTPKFKKFLDELSN